MRSQFTVAVLLGIAAASAADAADLANGGGYETYSPFVSRIEPVIIYDFEPGVIYWCPLWQNLHYFPRTGKRPKVGRREVLPTTHAEASGVLSVLVGLVRICSATLANGRAEQ